MPKAHDSSVQDYFLTKLYQNLRSDFVDTEIDDMHLRAISPMGLIKILSNEKMRHS